MRVNVPATQTNLEGKALAVRLHVRLLGVKNIAQGQCLLLLRTAHTFCTSRDTRVSYGCCLLIQRYFCAF